MPHSTGPVKVTFMGDVRSGRETREFDAKVCVLNLHTAHFSLVVVAPLIADRQLPRWSLSCTIGVRQRCGGVEVDTPS